MGPRPDDPPAPLPPPSSVPPRVRGSTGAYPAAPPPAGAAPAPPPRGTGAFPAAPPRPTGGHAAVAPPTGGFPAVGLPASQRPAAPPSTGAYRAAGAARPATPPSGLGPLAPPASSGALPAVGRRPTSDLGRAPLSAQVGAPGGPPSTGALQAVGALPAEGDELDGFRILKTIGKGSMGRVYRARDPAGRDVALKLILADQADAEGLARFEREGQAMAAVPRHRNVVNVHTTGTARGLPYLVCDLVEGTSLVELLKRGPLPVARAVAMGEALARAVDHVHRAGVLHRDLKPANILIRGDDGEPVITDFGMAGMRGAERLTRTGDLLGTPLYMPPEQVLGLHRQIDARSDVWALGTLIYEMLAGEPPFGGSSLVELSKAITQGTPKPLVHIDQALEEVVLRALAKRREDRWPSAGALADALAAWRERPSAEQRAAAPRRPRPVVPLLAGGAGLAVALAVGAVAWQARRRPDAPPPGGAGGGEPTATATATPPPPGPTPPPPDPVPPDLAAAIAGPDPRAALTALKASPARVLALPTVAEALEARALAAARARPPERLAEWLRALALARADAPPRTCELASSAVAAAHAVLEATRTDVTAAAESTALVEAAAACRLRGVDADAARRFVEAFGARFLAALSARDGEIEAPYRRLLKALVALDVGVRVERILLPPADDRGLEADVLRTLFPFGGAPADPETRERAARRALQLSQQRELGPVVRAQLLSVSVPKVITSEADNATWIRRLEEARDQLDPTNVHLHLTLGHLHANAKHAAEATAEFSRVLELAKGIPQLDGFRDDEDLEVSELEEEAVEGLIRIGAHADAEAFLAGKASRRARELRQRLDAARAQGGGR